MLGEGLGATRWRRRSRLAVVGDDVAGVASGLSSSRSSARRDEDEVAELPSALARRGVAGGRGYGERRRQTRSGVLQRESRGRESEMREWEKGQGARGRLRRSVEDGGGSRRWKQEVASGARAGDTPLPSGRGGRRLAVASGLGRLEELGQVGC